MNKPKLICVCVCVFLGTLLWWSAGNLSSCGVCDSYWAQDLSITH